MNTMVVLFVFFFGFFGCFCLFFSYLRGVNGVSVWKHKHHVEAHVTVRAAGGPLQVRVPFEEIALEWTRAHVR